MSTLKNVVSGSVIIEGRPYDEFQVFTGGKVTAPTVKDRAPGADWPHAIATAKDVDAISLSRTFDLDRDGALLAEARQKCGTDDCSVSLFVRDQRKNVKLFGTFPATLVGVAGPEGDTNDETGKAVFALDFAASGVVG